MSSHAMPNVLQNLVAVKTEIAPVDQEANDPSAKINLLSAKIHYCKLDIKKIADKKAEYEAELLEICGVKEEGTQKFNTDFCTVSTVGKLTRKITDVDVLRKLAPEVVRTKYELDIKLLKLLATSNPPLYTKALHCIETKAAKSSVSIEIVKGAA